MRNLRLSALALTTILFIACSSDDDAAFVNEEEVITTVQVTLTPQGGGTAVTLTSRHLDGDGPEAPMVTVSAPVTAGIVYSGGVTFLNELTNPAEDITEEVAAEGEEHQVFYQHNGLGTFTYNDEDGNGNPVGLDFTYTAGTAATGTLTVILRHEPNKEAQGVAEGIITNAGGSTDAEVVFNVVVQ